MSLIAGLLRGFGAIFCYYVLFGIFRSALDVGKASATGGFGALEVVLIGILPAFLFISILVASVRETSGGTQY